MTISQEEYNLISSQLDEDILIGFRFTLARDDFRGILVEPTATPEEIDEAFDEFASNLVIAMFSKNYSNRLKSFDTESIAHNLKQQIDCLNSSSLPEVEAIDIEKILLSHQQEDSESGVKEMTLRALSEIVKPNLSSAS